MDIIHLLQVLKPAKDVVTVQILDEKKQWTLLIETLKAILPSAITALVTGFITWKAMSKSHEQFQISSQRQSEEFKLGIEQQIKTLKLNAKLQTEIEIKKENCSGVRDACVNFMSHLEAAHRYSFEFHQMISVGNDLGRDNAHNEFLLSLHKMSSSKLTLMTYLDLSNDLDKAFYIAIGNAEQELAEVNKDPSQSIIGPIRGKCIAACRLYILAKQKEISEISNFI